MQILVTGASGLLGASVARVLTTAGHTVSTLQRRPSGVTGARDFLGSVTDTGLVERAVRGCEAVIHLAAKVSMAGKPADFELINVTGTRTVVEAARSAGVGRFVHISSPSVAHTGTSIIGEGPGVASPEHARGDYARTKAAGELLALAASSPDFHVLALRPHLMWGPGDTQLTERIIDRARTGRLPILGAGTVLVDTLFMTNAVEAIVAGLEASVRHHGQALVVTNGQPRPVGELLNRIALAGGARPIKYRIPAAVARTAGTAIEGVWNLGTHDDEPPLTRFLAEQLSTAHWFDQRRTHELLGWRPRISIEQGLKILAKHYQNAQ